ncbi:cytokinin riboside 5'-monophosphate phosphoribohydrolase [Neptunitalea chrysea]|uniref:Cytokinin riboside 5'-monophosphate phosphoribohydrolase n=1 Tax=Neptunitalea chrysea TaxID=1647581 RepID=A0A9W6B4D2_9FLAO|nr:TIGR00730 family Rossman fold protein [Neptunitalea chrysea]GLB51102.1 cytokinin riboside 5'-monophosphate phosphoribohydrolase [Neptunitalea chrysea]
MKNIVVFCGSSSGTDPLFEEQAYLLGTALAEQKITLIYGGSKLGLMGKLADGVLENNGNVTGVLPYFLQQKEVAHLGIDRLILVETMLERKEKMNELCDGVITLPGGYGTLDELFEMLTWAQLGLHKKPIGILNIAGYYDELIAFFDTMVNKGLLKPNYRQMVVISNTIDDLLEKMRNYEAPNVTQWIGKEDI